LKSVKPVEHAAQFEDSANGGGSGFDMTIAAAGLQLKGRVDDQIMHTHTFCANENDP